MNLILLNLVIRWSDDFKASSLYLLQPAWVGGYSLEQSTGFWEQQVTDEMDEMVT